MNFHNVIFKSDKEYISVKLRTQCGICFGGKGNTMQKSYVSGEGDNK